jgi:hypothetical protein
MTPTRDLPPLDGDLEALLREERARPLPSPDVQQRVFGRLEATLLAPTAFDAADGPGDAQGFDASADAGLGDAVAGGGAAAAGGATIATLTTKATVASVAGTTAVAAKAAGGVGVKTVLSALVAGNLALGATTFVAGGVVGASLHAAYTEPPAVQAPTPAQVQPTPPPPPPVLELPPEPEPAPAAVAPEPVAPAPPARQAEPKPSPARPPERDATLGEERSLIEMARTSLGRGKAEAALTPLLAHQQRFEHGQLTEEREVLVIQVLKALGRDDEARRRADDFRERFPKSLLTPAVDATLEE